MFRLFAPSNNLLFLSTAIFSVKLEQERNFFVEASTELFCWLKWRHFVVSHARSSLSNGLVMLFVESGIGVSEELFVEA